MQFEYDCHGFIGYLGNVGKYVGIVAMDFFSDSSRRKIIRTTLYGDQEFSLWELEILHTPVVQRLYDLKQLGFADRVYPDAVHSRFNHILGVAEVAERMARRVVTWLQGQRDTTFEYAEQSGGNGEWTTRKIYGHELAERIQDRIAVIRLVGLLHDLTHAAFGHTLEDEVRVFQEKHDAPLRQIRFFDALVAQLVMIWSIELGIRDADPTELERLTRLEIDPQKIKDNAEAIREHTRVAVPLAKYLKDLEFAFRLLLDLEMVHGSLEFNGNNMSRLVVSKVRAALDPNLLAHEHVFHRDLFMLDIVGNTICADLVDYAQRDTKTSGLQVKFDERLLRYMCIVSVDGPLSPDGNPALRLAVQFFTNKMRHDVLSEMSAILKARYLISERILFHPTKCAAGACLGTAIQLIGLSHPPDSVQVLGDQAFTSLLSSTAKNMGKLCDTLDRDDAENSRLDEILSSLWPVSSRTQDLIRCCLGEIVGGKLTISNLRAKSREIRQNSNAARVLLWKLSARRYPKLVYRLQGDVRHSDQDDAKSLAAKYGNPQARFQLERKVETMCHLPLGSEVIHCPKRSTTMKVAQALIVGSDLKRAHHLRDIRKVISVGLEPYEDEIRAIERMYMSIWQLHVFVDIAHLQKHRLVARVMEHEIGFPNDNLLSAGFEEDESEPKTVYDVLASERWDDIPLSLLPRIVEQLDSAENGMHYGETITKLRKRVDDAISAATAD